MSAQLGIPHYKDLINSLKLSKLKDNINKICLNFSKLSSSDAIEHREDERYDIYKDQYLSDLIYIKNMIIEAQNLLNNLNDTMFTISSRAIEKHVYNYDN